MEYLVTVCICYVNLPPTFFVSFFLLLALRLFIFKIVNYLEINVFVFVYICVCVAYTCRAQTFAQTSSILRTLHSSGSHLPFHYPFHQVNLVFKLYAASSLMQIRFSWLIFHSTNFTTESSLRCADDIAVDILHFI